MSASIRILINNRDYEGLKQALSQNAALADEGVPLDDKPGSPKAHPLHRICDGSFQGRYSNEDAAEMAKIFLSCGADVNGHVTEIKKDTPLVAAASLDADPVALLCIDHGANIHHAGCSGGTALHWAAYRGREVLVKRLIEEGADINQTCIDFGATPLLWAIHGLKEQQDGNINKYLTCIKLLIQSGADKNIPNARGITATDQLGDNDIELRKILSNDTGR